MTARGKARGPVLGRRQAAALAAGALVAGSVRSVQAADASTFVSGFALPMNLDPWTTRWSTNPMSWTSATNRRARNGRVRRENTCMVQSAGEENTRVTIDA